MRQVEGLHHVTAIAGSAQENVDFYAGLLGMRLVKRSVNQDDPGTYHLFYADAAGHPGTDLTFFPWAQLAPSRPGAGLANEVSLAVAPASLGWWEERLAGRDVRRDPVETRFGERVLPIEDPHGLRVALVETASAHDRAFAPWEGSTVPAEHQIRGLDGARIQVRQLAPTTAMIGGAMGYRSAGSEGAWHRWEVPPGGSGRHLDVHEMPEARRGAWGTGSIHHLAFRVADDAHQLAVRAQVEEAGALPTDVIDRFWFRSVYFKEPGGVLFELATDGPGFGVDEAPEHLGESLVLPPWLEAHRPEIEAVLPPLTLPGAS